MIKKVTTTRAVGDSLSPGLARAIYEQAKQQSQTPPPATQQKSGDGGKAKE